MNSLRDEKYLYSIKQYVPTEDMLSPRIVSSSIIIIINQPTVILQAV